MFQKKVTINGNIICIEISNEVGHVKVDIADDTQYFNATKMLFDTLKVTYEDGTTEETKEYWDPKFKLIMSEIINSIYSIGLKKLDPDKNFADYDLVREE